MSRPRSVATEAQSAAPDYGALGEWTVALSESRGVGREVGVAGIEKSHGKCVVSQIADSQTYIKTVHWLRQRPPSHVLLPAGSLQTPSILYQVLKHVFPFAQIHAVDRSAFSDGGDGLAVVLRIMSSGSSEDRSAIISHLHSRYYALGALNAVLSWLGEKGTAWNQGCLDVEWKAVEGTMLIDGDTVKDLELLSNLLHPKSNQSLLGLLNHCVTPMGTRMLRSHILAPSTDVDTLNDRLNAVQDLVANDERFTSLRQTLKLVGKTDAEKLVGFISSHRTESPKASAFRGPRVDPAAGISRKIQVLLSLRQVIKALPAVAGALSGTPAKLLVKAESILRDQALSKIQESITERINDEAAAGLEKGAMASKNQKAYAVKAVGNPFLDVARKTYQENIGDALDLAEQLKQEHELEDLQIKQEQGSGFVLTISKASLEDRQLPHVFTNVVTKGKMLRFTCLDLKKKNQRITDSFQEICALSDEALDLLIFDIQKYLSSLFRASEAIALLDVLASFATTASTQSYVRPEFTDTLAIINGRHPVQERFRYDDGCFVPNDSYVSEACTFQIITGPNMSGKSTFLRQVAMLVIMSQIGSYVPADYASFRIQDALLSRLSNDDNIEASLSTFAAEMQTMAMILSAIKICEAPLLIVDELGRGTSPIEGVGIAHAIAQEIIEAKATCFFATHFRELVTTLSIYPNVACLHLSTEVRGLGIKFHHRVTDGPTKQLNYGLQLARLHALPSDVVEEATRVTQTLERLEQAGKLSGKSSAIIARRGIIYDVTTALSQLHRYGRVSGEAMKKLLVDLQNDTIERLAPSSTVGSSRVVSSSAT